ncbi:hypothetical protein [Corallococcus exiguus]|uniref:Uncharacterized protein n=1 Tax=Corallococcus exiguus TaxID=83462 RepID=A0A7X4Y6L8_9BACT|nr:hypothetical protein [Corallococcus exiguus]NBC39888.1 hypothetical protein [Corallococcus exiguus]TNV61355.1 hypothetical protein FH620_21370 [Corallococcus exiguus]
MDFISKVFNVLKSWFYELLAVLVPGSVIMAIWPWGVTLQRHINLSSTESLVVFAYIAGILNQGVGDLVTRRIDPPRAANKDYKTCNALREQVARIVGQRLSAAQVQVPDSALLGICLTQVEGKREVYDKFVALRDMSRGLMVAAVVGGAITLGERYNSLQAWQVAAIIALSVGTAVAFYSRYRRYQPLAEQALYEVFLAMELKTLAPASATPSLPPKP